MTSLPPSAAGPPIGHLGRAGTGRGLEKRRRLRGQEWGLAYVNLAAQGYNSPRATSRAVEVFQRSCLDFISRVVWRS